VTYTTCGREIVTCEQASTKNMFDTKGSFSYNGLNRDSVFRYSQQGRVLARVYLVRTHIY